MRTQDEIVARIELVKQNDMFGFEWVELVAMLDFAHAKPYLKEEAKAEEWQQRNQESVRQTMIDYMDFAWKKANNCRGISASRSISHYKAWLWLDGSPEAMSLLNTLDNYNSYGKPQLRTICRYLGLDPDKWDDGRRGDNEEEMDNCPPIPVDQRD